MRDKLEPVFEKRRIQKPGYPRTDHTWGPTGFFIIPYLYGEARMEGGVKIQKRAYLHCMATAGTEEHPWEHVSVTLTNEQRCPTWEEMCAVKEIFWKPDEGVVQYHPPKDKNISFHPHCLHLWRPWGGAFPQPPQELVGPIPEDDETRMKRIRAMADANKRAAEVIDQYVQARLQDNSIDYFRQSSSRTA